MIDKLSALKKRMMSRKLEQGRCGGMICNRRYPAVTIPAARAPVVIRGQVGWSRGD